MGLIFYALIVSVPALIFSILSWRLRTQVMFWLGVVFTVLLLILFLVNIRFLIYLFQDINEMLTGLFLAMLLGLPLYFLIASKSGKPKSGLGSDITDDYLNSIIESEDEDVKFD